MVCEINPMVSEASGDCGGILVGLVGCVMPGQQKNKFFVWLWNRVLDISYCNFRISLQVKTFSHLKFRKMKLWEVFQVFWMSRHHTFVLRNIETALFQLLFVFICQAIINNGFIINRICQKKGPESCFIRMSEHHGCDAGTFPENMFFLS